MTRSNAILILLGLIAAPESTNSLKWDERYDKQGPGRNVTESVFKLMAEFHLDGWDIALRVIYKGKQIDITVEDVWNALNVNLDSKV